MTMNRSTSELLTFQECPQKWANIYHHQRAPKDTPPDATDRGSTAHEALEYALNCEREGTPFVNMQPWWRDHMENHYGERSAEKGYLPHEKHLKEIEILSISMSQYWSEHGLSQVRAEGGDLLGAEIILEDGGMKGILDCLKLDSNGSLWHRQYKTLGRSSDMPVLVRRVKRSLHESVYATLIEARYLGHYLNDDHPYGWPYMGVELVMFPLDGLHRRMKGSTCTHCGDKGYEYRPPTYEVIEIPLRHEIRERGKRDTTRILDHIQAALEVYPFVPFEQREGSCYNYNRVCPFIDVCDGHLTIDDPNYFRDRDPSRRYKKEPTLKDG